MGQRIPEKEIANFLFANLPFERGEILFSKGFFYLYGYSQTTRKSQNFIYSKHKEVEVWL